MTFLINYGADILVIVASLGAMGYCMVLSRRLSRLTSFDKGLGGAIAVMSSQVDEMKAALREAKAGSDGAGQQLNELVNQAKDISTELEMMIAACHDFAEEAISTQLPSEDKPQEAEEFASQDLDEQSPLEDAEITPIFGSRRAPDDVSETTASVASPLFRHRKLEAG